MKSRYLTCAGYEIHFTEWGAGNREAVMMWHGLARSGRDFDFIADPLSRRYRVICPDTIGRGLSQWARDREREYCFRVYGDVALDLLRQLEIDTLRWVGTSMGGLIGVTLAAERLQTRISHLLINDIGPEVPKTAAARIVDYVGKPPEFARYEEFETWIRTVYSSFGAHADSAWRHLAETTCRRTDDGRLAVHYDPKIVTQFTTHAGDLDCWPAYDRIACKTLLLRGEVSDVLPNDTARRMTERGPRCTLVEIEGVGHAPVLDTPAQVDLVERFLAS